MTYYPTLAEDLARAKEILAKGQDLRLLNPLDRECSPLVNVGTIYGADIYAAYKLLESFVAAIEQFQLDQKMLATVIRNTVIALADVPDEWEGSVDEGVTLINANVARIQAHIAELEHALNNCELHAGVEGIRERTACAVCYAELQQSLEAMRITAITARCRACGAYTDDITVERGGGGDMNHYDDSLGDEYTVKEQVGFLRQIIRRAKELGYAGELADTELATQQVVQSLEERVATAAFVAHCREMHGLPDICCPDVTPSPPAPPAPPPTDEPSPEGA